jgi:hypothetical protein
MPGVSSADLPNRRSSVCVATKDGSHLSVDFDVQLAFRSPKDTLRPSSPPTKEKRKMLSVNMFYEKHLKPSSPQGPPSALPAVFRLKKSVSACFQNAVFRDFADNVLVSD